VENSLPEKISLKGSWVSVKRRFALRRAVEVVPRLGRHLLARDGTQLSKAHLLSGFSVILIPQFQRAGLKSSHGKQDLSVNINSAT
jgi:hypothetical protein